MKFNQLVVVIVISILAAAGTVFYLSPKNPHIETQSKESAYERIMRTGTIRCGYINWFPAVARDAKTGQMNGYVVDYIEALAKAMELKVIWQEEINLGTYLEDLRNGRYDLECAGGWPNATRGKFAYYTTPFAYSPLVAFVRSDDIVGVQEVMQYCDRLLAWPWIPANFGELFPYSLGPMLGSCGTAGLRSHLNI